MTLARQSLYATAANLFRVVLAVGLAIFLLRALKIVWHWPFVGDAQVIHYVVFLMHHGLAPYREIYDMNMPGAYLFEGWALALFGASDFGWTLYDLFLAATMAAGMITIARRYDWIAGFAAAGIFTLTHFADGPAARGQRDQVMAVLLVVACTFLFESVRLSRAWLMFPFALAAAMAASIKPTLLPVGFFLLVLASFQLRRSGVRLGRYWLYALGGSLLAAAIVVAFLGRTHSTGTFVYTLTRVLPHYGGLRRMTLQEMVAHSLPQPVAIFLLLGIVAAAMRWVRQNWEEIALLAFAGFGALNYFAQGKGFPQHRYTMLAFLLLWICLQILQALTASTRTFYMGVAGIVFCLLFVCRRELYGTRLYPQQDAYSSSLERDLAHLGTAPLQHQVQCLDIIDGCLTALYHLQIVQSTGATGDLSLFQPVLAPEVVDARTKFWSLIQKNPPTVYVLSNAVFGMAPRSFDSKLENWPEFSALIRSEYVPVQQRAFRYSVPIASTLGVDSSDIAYRIYIRRDSPLSHASDFRP
jgi:hypothetical protein